MGLLRLPQEPGVQDEVHEAAWVEVDRCRPCRLVWFDPLELDALNKAGWVALLRALLQGSSGDPSPGAAINGPCPRCQHTLEPNLQQNRHGRSAGLECPQCHGQAQRDGALLASRGLFRPLLLAERVALATERRRLCCLQCGAPIDGRSEQCGHCRSPATVFDLPRLSLAIGLIDEGAEAQRCPHASDGAAPVQVWACRGCGQPLDPSRQSRCPSCAYPVLAPAMADLLPLLAAAERRLAHVAAEVRNSALGFLPAVERRQVAALTGRGEHDHAVDQLQRTFYRRYAVLTGACALMALLIWNLLR